jgi:hypothetical protein
MKSTTTGMLMLLLTLGANIAAQPNSRHRINTPGLNEVKPPFDSDRDASH